MAATAFSVAEETTSGAEPTRDPINLVHEQLDVWCRDRQAHRVWAEPATKSIDYIEGRQWDPEDVRQLDIEGRPHLTFNRIGTRFNLVVGYALQNQTDTRYLPASDAAASHDIATALTHTKKQIDEANQAQWVEAEVFVDGLASGRGFFNTELDFRDNTLGTIRTKAFDPFSVYLDCDAGEYDISEHNHVTTTAWMSIEDMARRYGGKTAEKVFALGPRRTVATDGYDLEDIDDDFAPPRLFGLRDYLRDAPDRFSRIGHLQLTGPIDHVDRQRRLFRTLSRQHKRLKKVRLAVDQQTGDKIVLPDWWDDQKLREVWQRMSAQGYQITFMPGLEHAWRWTVSCMDVVLWDDWSPYERPTLVGFFPYFRRGVTRGFADDLIDPQNEVNKRRSALIFAIMQVSNQPWVIEKGTVDEATKVGLEQGGAIPGYVLEWSRHGNPNAQAPRRMEPGTAPQGLTILTQKAEDDLEDISGVNKSAMGEIDRVQSGRAIENRQRQTIIAHERAFSGLKRTRELRGRQDLELVQRFYTEPRLIRTIGSDGGEVSLMINQRVGPGEIKNDLTIGRYKVAIDETPTSATFLSAQFAEGLELVKEGVIPPQLIVDHLIDASTLSRKQELKERAQMMLGMAPGAPGAAPPPGGAPAPMAPPAGPAVGPPGGMAPMAGPAVPPPAPMAPQPMAPAPPMPGNPGQQMTPGAAPFRAMPIVPR